MYYYHYDNFIDIYFLMEKIIYDYLRILDIDPLGYFIRLINKSYHQEIDLKNISIRQFNINNQTLNSYIFNDKIRYLLHSGEVVTIYSKDYDRLESDIEPYVFIAQDISRWLIDNHIQTEISINEIVFDCCKNYLLSTTDIPLLFNNPSTVSKQLSIKTILPSNQYARFIYPYCLSMDNIVNPHTYATSDQDNYKTTKNICSKLNETVKHFDSYPRRLTTAPKIIQLSKEL